MSTHNIPFLNMKKKVIFNYPDSAALRFFQGTQERVRNSRGKQAIGVRATAGLLYTAFIKSDHVMWRRCLVHYFYTFPVHTPGSLKSYLLLIVGLCDR